MKNPAELVGGLKAELMEGAVARTRVNEERAKFESVFYTGISYSAADLARSGGATSSDYYAGLRKPLPTGGSVALEVSGGRDESSNGQDRFPLWSDLSFSQPLLKGAGVDANVRSIHIAQLESGMVNARMKQRVINLLVRADTAYWNLYSAVKELEVRREQYQLAEDQLEHARKQVASRAAARIEIVRAEAGVAGRLEAVINAENKVASRNRNLLQIMGVPNLQIDRSVDIAPETNPHPLSLKLDREELIDFALENRMETAQMELQLAIDDLSIERAVDQIRPDLSLTGRLGLGGESDHYSDASTDAYVGLSLSVPVGNRAAKLQLERARLYRLINEAEEVELEQLVQQQVLDAVGALESSWRRILAAEQGVQAAERDYRVEQSQFQLGVRTSTDVLQAATRLAEAQLSRIRAFADYEIAQISLATATGTMLGRSGIVMDQLPAFAESF
ncbi:MAG: TolC family protein [Pontiellaceae bacterium]|nr:TolC family protein [Pontiellaceae bacterium]